MAWSIMAIDMATVQETTPKIKTFLMSQGILAPEKALIQR